MRIVIASLLLALTAGLAHAADTTCAAQATEKRLAGAAKSSFMRKCEKDAKPKCDAMAAEKKLAGAAKNSFIKKCEKDSAAAPAASK